MELHHKALGAFNRRDIDAFVALMDDDVHVVPRAVAMEGGYHGHEGVRRWWANLLDVWPDLTMQIVELRDGEDRTVAALHIRGRGAGSDIPLEWTLWQVAEWRGKKCVWFRALETPEAALAAAGLSEQDTHADS